MAREKWGSKLGIIMAVAGSAVGLGNFLRFPGQVAQHGGGAFIIPYLVALVLLGIPLMWVEWTIGRYGGGFGHSTAPGAFHTMARKARFMKYFGVIGIFGPTVIFIYYTYIESWLAGYSWFAATGAYSGCTDAAAMGGFLDNYLTMGKKPPFLAFGPFYVFFLLTFAANVGVVLLGVNRGIERVCMYAMPLLFLLAIVLAVRVLTLGTPDPGKPDQNVLNGLGFLWNPQWGALADPGVWLAAAGQIFFTLSVGIGVILTYASYLRKTDDVVLSGLTASATNEFAEVILGGSIVIPAAVIFLGSAVTAKMAGNTFGLGFVAMPLAMQKMAGADVFGFCWFGLLFLAGITSSISLAQPAVAFLQDEFRLTRRGAVLVFGGVSFLLIHACIFLPAVIDELDFWGGTFCLVVFATVEAILFAWVFGMDKAWDEMHCGADMRIPRIYRFIIKWVTPAFLLAILGSWLWQKGLGVMTMSHLGPADAELRPYIVGTRLGLVVLFAGLCLLVWLAWRRRAARGEEAGPGTPVGNGEDRP